VVRNARQLLLDNCVLPSCIALDRRSRRDSTSSIRGVDATYVRILVIPAYKVCIKREALKPAFRIHSSLIT